MFAIAAVLTIVMISVVITRIATMALRATGVSKELARFQARSAFTGVGFTTDEAESVVGHPVRRRLVMVLMLLGNAGLVTVVASLVLGFSEVRSPRDAVQRLSVLGIGLLLLWGVTASRAATRAVEHVIQRALARWTDLHVRDYVQLLDLEHDYEVRELEVDADDWLAGRSLRELALSDEGVLVLGVRRDAGEYLGAPDPDFEMGAGDTVVVYGREDNLTELARRHAGPAGNHAHDQAVAEQRQVQASERERDAAR